LVTVNQEQEEERPLRTLHYQMLPQTYAPCGHTPVFQ